MATPTHTAPPAVSTDLFGLGFTHPDSPKIRDIVACTDKSKRLTDPKGYRVENLGWSKGHGVPYGYFAARGVAHGGLYQFSVTEWRLHSLPNVELVHPLPASAEGYYRVGVHTTIKRRKHSGW